MLSNLKEKIAQRVSGFLDFYSNPRSMDEHLSRLRRKGVQIGNQTVIYDCVFDAVYPWLIRIGDDCTLSGAQILVHDDSPIIFMGRRQVDPVSIGDRVFIGRGAIILPGVSIGSDVIVGAGSIVTKSIPDGKVVAGNPAKVIASVSEVCSRKESSGTLIPYHFVSNLVTMDEDILVQDIVQNWMKSSLNEHESDQVIQEASP